MTEAQDRTEKRPKEAAESPAARILRAEELFRGDREVWIEHAGVRYRLRITRRNKLILQK
ncbi:MAG: hemin uptake protein HemP [Gemmataceae bacterium]|nr:hemin uptake protein HemP [Gemmataceae bacterium]